MDATFSIPNNAQNLSSPAWGEDHRPIPITRRASRRRRGRDTLSTEEWERLARALRLSPRELQIAQGIFDDLKEAAIADRLAISAHTVHTHIERMYRKLAVAGRAQLIIAILAEHLSIIDASGADPRSPVS